MNDSKLPLQYSGYAVSTIAWLEDTWKVCPHGASRVVQQAKTNNFATLEVVGQKFTVTHTDSNGLFAVKVERMNS